MTDPTLQFDMNETEFLKLFVKNELALRVYARAILPDWDLVDEALQEASVTMWQKREQLQEANGFLPWAKVILRFKCLRQLETLRKRRPVLSDEMIETLVERGEQRSAEKSQLLKNALQFCLSQFSAEHQELLLAPYRSTDKVVDLAERRKKSVNSLYKLLGRLRDQLSACVRRKTSVEMAQ